MNMAARIQAPLRLEDLDREELLRLVLERQKTFPLAMFEPSDLLSVRYDVAQERVEAAREKDEAAWEAYRPHMLGFDPKGMSDRAFNARIKQRDTARRAYEATRRAVRRAEGVRDRAWKALDQHWKSST